MIHKFHFTLEMFRPKEAKEHKNKKKRMQRPSSVETIMVKSPSSMLIIYRRMLLFIAMIVKDGDDVKVNVCLLG